jgi:O-antigen/teichoic acid export membrane protein
MIRAEQKKTLLALLATGGWHVVALGASLVAYSLLARVLGPERLGAWVLVGTSSFLLNLTDLGLGAAVQRAAVAGDLERARRALGLALVPLCTLAPLAAIVAYAALCDIPSAPIEVQRDLDRAAWLALAAGLIAALGAPYRGYVIARGGGQRIFAFRAVQGLLYLALMGPGLLLWQTLLVPAASVFVVNLVEAGVAVQAARSLDPLVPLRPALPRERAEILAALRDGAAVLVINLSAALAVRVDVVVLARAAPLAAVAAYSVAARSVEMLYLIAKQATPVLMPKLGDPSQREGAVRLGTAVLTGVVATGLAAFAVNGQPVLVAWVGVVADNDITSTALAILAVAAVLMSGEEIVGSMLTLGGKTVWATAVPCAAGALVNIAISLLGARRFGVWAVAGSTVVGNVVMTVLAWRNAGRVLGPDASRLGQSFGPPLAGGLVSLGAAWALEGFARTHLIASIASCALPASAGALVAALLVRQLGSTPRAAPREPVGPPAT